MNATDPEDNSTCSALKKACATRFLIVAQLQAGKGVWKIAPQNFAACQRDCILTSGIRANSRHQLSPIVGLCVHVSIISMYRDRNGITLE